DRFPNPRISWCGCEDAVVRIDFDAGLSAGRSDGDVCGERRRRWSGWWRVGTRAGSLFRVESVCETIGCRMCGAVIDLVHVCDVGISVRVDCHRVVLGEIARSAGAISTARTYRVVVNVGSNLVLGKRGNRVESVGGLGKEHV